MMPEKNRKQEEKEDMAKQSMIMTLQEIKFSGEEIEIYMQLLEKEGSAAERLHILNKKRAVTLDQIHFYEKRLEWMDYLRHQIRCGR